MPFKRAYMVGGPQQTLIPLVLRQISAQLPYITRQTLEETESDEFFEYINYFIAKISGSGHYNEVLEAVISLLDKITANETVSSLEDFKEATLNSLLIVLRLLTDLAKKEWSLINDTGAQRTSKPADQKSVDHVYTDIYNKRLKKLYSNTLPPLESELVVKSVEKLLKLRSKTKVRRAYHILQNDMTRFRAPPEIINEIDFYCEFIVFFLCASNWDEVYPLIRTNIETTISNKEAGDIIPRVDELSFLYIDEPRFNIVLRDIHKWTKLVQNPIHDAYIHYFSQESILYWVEARADKCLSEIVNDPDSSTSAFCRDLFDKCSDRYHGMAGMPGYIQLFLSTLIPLLHDSMYPEASQSSNQTAPKVRKRFSGNSNSVFRFLSNLESSLASSDSNKFGTSLRCHIFMVRAAACFQQFAPDCALVKHVNSMYHQLQYALYENSNRFNKLYNLNDLRSDFISKYSFLRPSDVEDDFFLQVGSANQNLTDKITIFRAVLGIGDLSYGGARFKKLFALLGTSTMAYIAGATESILQYEANSNSTPEPYDYDSMVEILTLCLIFFRGVVFQSADSPGWVEKLYNYKAPKNSAITTTRLDQHLTIKAVRCARSRDKMLHITASNILHDLIRDNRLADDFGTVQRPFLLEIFEMIGQNITFLTQKMDFLSIQPRDFEDALLRIKRSLDARLYILEHYDIKDLIKTDMELLESYNSRFLLSYNLETTLLFGVCSLNMEICKLALNCLQMAVGEARALDEVDKPDLTHWSFLMNYEAYSDLCSHRQYFTPVSLHKKVFLLLQSLETPSDAQIKVWKLSYQLWERASNSAVLGSSRDSERQWKTHSGYLASLFVPMLNKDGYNNVPADLSAKASTFLKFMVNTLASDQQTVLIESCRDVCTSDLSPLAYSSLLVELNANIERRKQSEGGIGIRLISQAALLLKAIIVRTTAEKMYLGFDISTLTMFIVEYMNKEYDSDKNLKLSIQVATLLRAMGSASDTLNLNNEMVMRNKMARILIDWLCKSVQKILIFSSNSGKELTIDYQSVNSMGTHSNGSSNTIMSTNSTSYERKDPEILRLRIEQSLEISKALTLIIDKLSLISVDGDRVRGISDNEAKYALFGKLFDLLLNVLRQLQLIAKHMSSRVGNFGSSSGATNRGYTQKIKTTLSQVILALSNLLTANTAIGLNITIPLGYDKDLDLRLAFLKIFKNIISRGTKLSTYYNIQTTYNSMVNFLVNNVSATLTLAGVCTSQDLDDFSHALASLFDQRGLLVPLVEEAVAQEIFRTSSVQGLLRRNCVATKLLVFFAKSRGQLYLETTLGSYLAEVLEHASQYPFDNLPNSELNGSLPSVNDARLFKKCLEELVNRLFETMDLVPESIRFMCAAIGDAADERFPGSRKTAVNGFFFLRFLCPALASPEKHGLLDPSGAQYLRKCLLFVAKTIQSIANGNTDNSLKVGSSQIYVEATVPQKVLNMLELLAEPQHTRISKQTTDASLGSISSHPSLVSTISLTSFSSPEFIVTKSAGVVHRFIVEHWDEIQRKLMWETRKERIIGNQSSKAVVTEHETIYQFTNLVRDLQCVEVPAESAVGVQMSLSLVEFMKKNSGRDVSSVIDSHVIEQGVAKDGKPVLVFTVRKYEGATIDAELLMLRFFQLLQTFNSTYYIIWDWSGYYDRKEYSLSGLAFGYALIFQELEENCGGIFYYNVPWEAIPVLREFITRKVQATRLTKTKVVHQIISSSSLANYFDIRALNLCHESESMVFDVRFAFPDVQLVLSNRTSVPVVIKIGHEYIQIEGVKPTKVIADYTGYFNTTGRLNDLVSVYADPDTNVSSNIFYVEFAGEDRVITLESLKRDEIIRAIKTAERLLSRKTSLSGQGVPDLKGRVSGRRQLVQRIDDMLPALLNMGLTNICSSNVLLQQGAYDLLAAISTRFKIGFGTMLIGGPSLGIPCRDITMAVALSTASAETNVELTYEFLREFSRSFSDLGPDQRSISINLIVPWVKNAYRHIFEADAENGRPKMSSIVRDLLELSFKQQDQYSLLVFSVWPCLCLEDGLCTLIIEEMLRFASEKSLSEEELNSLLTIVTSFPTVGMTGAVLKMIKDALYRPLHPDTKNDDDTFYVFKNLQILVKITCSLIFNSNLILERYFPDLLLIVSLLSYMGPNSFRLVVHSLLVNILHVFTTKNEEHGQLLSLWNELCSDKLKTSFGISDEANISTSEFMLFTGIYHLEKITNFIMELLLHLNSNPKIWPNARPWQLRWYSLVMNYSFCENIDIRTRALVTLGCASRKLVIQEEVVRMLLEYLTTQSEDTDDLENYMTQLTTTFCALSKMVESLSAGAVYPARLFWVGLSWASIADGALYVQAIQLMQNSLSALDTSNLTTRSGDLVELLLDARHSLSHELEQADKALGNSVFDEDMIYASILSRLIRGLTDTKTRGVTNKSFETMLEIFHRNNVHSGRSVSTRGAVSETEPKNAPFPGYVCFLFMLYLGSQDELKDKFLLSGYGFDDLDQQLESGQIPDLIKSYLTEDSAESTIVLYLAAQVFRLWGSSGVFLMRFTKCIEFVHEVNNKKKRLVYSICRDKMVHIMEHATTQALARVAINCGVQTVVNDDEFASLAASRTAMKNMLERYGFAHTFYLMEASLNCSNGRVEPAALQFDAKNWSDIRLYTDLIRAVTFN